jgi:protein-L-isoaspartate(D-aspartate) O-methyltransferase
VARELKASKTHGIGMTSQRTRDRMVARLRENGIRDEAVLAAMASVPRHIFVDEGLASRAYEDTALPIGFEQTISQPFVVARMIEATRAQRPLGKVLEVGTGCGYQAALLAHIAKEVYSVERIAGLLEQARRNLRSLRLSNLRLVHADGSLGLPDAAPFDGIIVAAAAPVIPDALLQQLAAGGRMIVPVGSGDQALVLVERTATGLTEKWLDAVRFVPLRGGKQ